MGDVLLLSLVDWALEPWSVVEVAGAALELEDGGAELLDDTGLAVVTSSPTWNTL